MDRKSEKSRGVGVGPWSRTTKTNGFTGQVWVKKGIDEAKKARIACVFAGLMLYQPPSDD